MAPKVISESEIVATAIFSCVSFLLMGLVLILFFYFSRKKITQKELEKRDLEIQHQREQLHAIIVTQEEERKRIAQDLHDDISSKLNIVSLNTHLLSASNLTEAETKEITGNIINLTAKALENSRKIAHNLLPPVFEKFGLSAGVEELCAEFETSKLVKVYYKNAAEFHEKDIDRHLHVFRILQEFMNNSIRHGKASEIKISFSDENGIFTCNYEDNGIGFDSKSSENQKGLGMKNIDSRISFLNGTIQISSEVDKGFAANFTF
ncbi:ATP-binding protein [Flavobacterium sp. LC2016-01]|uniref:sensor histidine kinase n=1 Tax=Flavobacterium sp. LC2016-01 TaxID=2675876 RepID=UPI0012BAE073|nr:ATP-binding protein [Flavobacterium sp. LC2016-01]MTH17353.1 sensor histidine kinase [Flavobacterium sp. LC2016-01]